MQACTQWTHSDVWSQSPTAPECWVKIGDGQSEKKLRNCDRRAICNATHGIVTGVQHLSNNTSLSTYGCVQPYDPFWYYPEELWFSVVTLTSESVLSSRTFISKGLADFCCRLTPAIIAVPLSNLVGRRQSFTRWAPFLLDGQAQRKHSPAAFLLDSSLLSIPSILLVSFSLLSLDILLSFFKDFLFSLDRLIRPVAVCPEAFRAAISLNHLDSFINCSVSFNTWSTRWLLARSLGVAENSRGSCSCKVVSFGPWSLSIWETNSCSSPITEANHQTHCATKICWVRHGWAMTHSKAYIIISLSFSKVTGIWVLIQSNVRGCRYTKLIDSRYRYNRYRYHKNLIINKDLSSLVGIPFVVVPISNLKYPDLFIVRGIDSTGLA